MLKFDDRFARQDRCEPPPEFPLASPCSSIVHHLSGLSARALAPPPLASSSAAGRRCAGASDAGSRPFCLSCAGRGSIRGAASRGRRRSPVDSRARTTPWSVFQDGSDGVPGATRPGPWARRRRARRDATVAAPPTAEAVGGPCRLARRAPASARSLSRRSAPPCKSLSSPARSVDASPACNAARRDARPPCRRASDDRTGGRRARPRAKCTRRASAEG